jgi:hypothetical protein
MIASCSAWIIVTMSRIVDPRARLQRGEQCRSEADQESASWSSYRRGNRRPARRAPFRLEMASPSHPSGVANVAQ